MVVTVVVFLVVVVAVVVVAAGASAEVEFTLERSALRMWDNAAWDWADLTGDFAVMVGSSSRDIRLESAFEL